MSDPILKLDSVDFDYGGPPALESVSLEIEAGEFLGIVGPNGGGKTTLLEIMLGLLKPTRGTVSLFGRKPSETRNRIGYAPQQAAFPLDFPIKVRDVTLTGRLGRTPMWGPYRKNDRAVADEAMEECGVIDLADRPIAELSGGQRQRVLIARALASRPEALILDEPTSQADPHREERFSRLLKTLHQRMTIILVSHDVGFITGQATRVACLNRTLVCHPVESISSSDLEELYEEPVLRIRHHDLLPDEGEEP